MDAVLEVGKRIKRIRKIRELTQNALGDKIGISGNTISLYERGKSSAAIVYIDRIAEALKVPRDELLVTGVAAPERTLPVDLEVQELEQQKKRNKITTECVYKVCFSQPSNAKNDEVNYQIKADSVQKALDKANEVAKSLGVNPSGYGQISIGLVSVIYS